PDVGQLARVTGRLVAALAIGTVVGLQRELTHKPAGLRTHMLVALGTALFVVGCVEAGMDSASVSRVVQGLATGIGFIGGGAILKLATEREIHGLTTAAGIWTTAAASTVAALGQIAVALLGTILGLVVLVLFRRFEKQWDHRPGKNGTPHSYDDSGDL